MMGQSIAFARLTKIDESNRLVYGRACQEVPDHTGEIFDYEKSVPHFRAWSDEMSKATGGQSQGNIRAMHGKVAAGRVDALTYCDDEFAIDICAKIVDDNEWQKCLQGVYTGFSIGGSYGEKWADGANTRYEAKPTEISLVDRPCIPTATFFSIQKSDGSIMQKSFQTAEAETEYQVTGTPEEADALAKLLATNKMSIGDAVRAVSAALDAPIRSALEKRYVEDEPDAEYLASLMDMEKVAAREDVSPKEGASKYGDVKFADEKNNKYPIENEAHIRAAWNYANKPANAAKYSAEDLKSIKGKIIAAWKEKIDKAGPPSAEKSDQAGDMKKGLYECGQLAQMLQSLYYLAMQCKREAASEADNSPLPARLSTVVADIAGVYKDMATEEADELLAELTEADDYQPEVMQMAFGLAGSLAKAGARNSKSDAETLQKMHDLSASLGAMCGIPAEKMGKSGDMEKMISDAIAPMKKALAEAQAEIQKFKDMPAPARGVLRVVSKELDGVDVLKKSVNPVIRNGQVDEGATFVKSILSTVGQKQPF